MLTVTATAFACGRGGEVVVPPLGFEVTAGEAMLVTGENGAGKSTLLRTLAGLIPPIAGAVQVSGGPRVDDQEAGEVSAHAHYLGHRNGLKPSATVGANLGFWRAFLGRTGLHQEEALEAVGLPALLDVPLGHLSAGQQRRVAIARLLVSRRPIWILDEPTGALDAASQERFATLLDRHLAEGGIAIVATHQPLGLARPARSLRLERARLTAFAEDIAEGSEAGAWA